MAEPANLKQTLSELNGRGYKAYKQLKGVYSVGNFRLFFDWIQGDPFATPSRVRVSLDQAIAQFPPALFSNPIREIALRDFINRQAYALASQYSRSQGSGKSGLIQVLEPSQAILDRTSVLINSNRVELRFAVGLPAWGRRIAGEEAIILLCEALPRWISRSLTYHNLDAEAIDRHLAAAEDSQALRTQLQAHHLTAFIADGAILPRQSGVEDTPLAADVRHFQSPDSLKVTLHCPHRGAVTGMGIPIGVTLIVGGGFHGKSTLLQAIQSGIYNHIPGDGREFVVTNPTAIKIRSEEGRSIQNVDISPFINDLPVQQSTQNFSTQNASGSTSQAASIIEAMEAGSKLLLLDEDTSATNFMIRDRRMQMLIAKEKEPITPFVDQVQDLARSHQVSSILVMGGSGDYFDVADTVIGMDGFMPKDLTAQAKHIAHTYPTVRQPEAQCRFKATASRVMCSHPCFSARGHRRLKIRTQGLTSLAIGDQTIDLQGHEQFVEVGQLEAIALFILSLQAELALQTEKDSTLRPPMTMVQLLSKLTLTLKTQGLDYLGDGSQGTFSAFRPIDFAFAWNRIRGARSDAKAGGLYSSKLHNHRPSVEY